MDTKLSDSSDNRSGRTPTHHTNTLLAKLACLMATLVVLAGLTAAGAHPASAGVGSDRLNPGERLYPGQQINSKSGGYALIMQTDGNLVLYGPGMRVLWHADTRGSDTFLGNQAGDGNIVVYSQTPTLRALWNAGPRASHNTLVVQSDGNLVLYNIATGKPLWATWTQQPEPGRTCSLHLSLRLSKASGDPSHLTLQANQTRKDCTVSTVTFSAASGTGTKQCTRNVGWLPSGNYLLGTYHQNGHGTLAGRSEYHLDPVGGTSMCGRSGFAIHSDANVRVPSTRTSFYRGSNGCIKVSGKDLTTLKSMIDAYRAEGGQLVGVNVS